MSKSTRTEAFFYLEERCQHFKHDGCKRGQILFKTLQLWVRSDAGLGEITELRSPQVKMGLETTAPMKSKSNAVLGEVAIYLGRRSTNPWTMARGEGGLSRTSEVQRFSVGLAHWSRLHRRMPKSLITNSTSREFNGFRALRIRHK